MTTGIGRTGFLRIQGKHLAVGYHGRYRGQGVHSRVVADQSIFKMLGLNVDKVLGMGLQAELWREVSPSPFVESAPIAGVSIISFSANTPAGAGTLALTLAGAARQMTWTAPGGVASPVIDVRNGGTFTLVSSGSSVMISVNVPFLPTVGGPFADVVTFTRNELRVPNFDPQTDQMTLTNDVYPFCSCFKQTSKQPDNFCRSCYGLGIIPGYTKFGYAEFTFAATDPTNTLTNTSLFTEFTPFRLQITAGFLTGTVLSPVYAVAVAVDPASNAFQFQADTYLRQPAGTSAVVEYSVNAGPWTALTLLSQQAIAAGSTLQFRVTLTRSVLADRSPFFEILRARYARLDEPWIRVLKSMPNRPRSRESMGLVESDGSVRFWTVPLLVFDDTFPQDPDVVAPPHMNIIQPKAFLEFKEGAYVGKRYDLTNFSYSDPKGVFISQSFACRLLQPQGEMIARVF